MNTNPVLDATLKLARTTKTKDPAKIAEAQKALTEAKLRRAVGEALAAFPPLSDETKASIAHLLTTGGK
jgi:hypothetical protein